MVQNSFELCKTYNQFKLKNLTEYSYCTPDLLELTQFIIFNSKSSFDTISEVVDVFSFFDTVKRIYYSWQKNPVASRQVDYDLLALLTVFRASNWLNSNQHKILEEYITDLTDGYTNWDVLFPVQNLRIAVERALKSQVTGIVQGRNGVEVWFREGHIGSNQVSGMVILSPCYIQIKDVIDGSMYTYTGGPFPMSPLDFEDILMNCPKSWVYNTSIYSSNSDSQL
ncbi:hypothetical protein [Cryptosporidium parvum Iowa II]|uniref:Uncharacterized protein n=3 Tax=Cryptosporidium TaxID=5806 RepID=Q5CXA7_CRYPI|nr:hypothetical protein [Cryptosporidium parvum Iowa II]OLQ17587.1 hypothetical protein ChTU502y2012_406g0625 [Cryptosporidium hominis]QOY41061.1 Uncharacterized protein CPATCC_0013310 [Cryptosporidium parvum]WKS78290.1 hypothetical protein CPCDC_6g1810 [Cryptosporidium sp. 43IA8]EAK89849.1 hypothetical protein cgd6_1810 [Cryptosporidium parvum Iowa II]PPA64843.1 hypothetical protein ChUKH1_02185 [Cryptosporidium hominis]|eukprot:QOY41061.1 hypothetical protein CPATCC_002703 [Cryptosporidium parvum]